MVTTRVRCVGLVVVLRTTGQENGKICLFIETFCSKCGVSSCCPCHTYAITEPTAPGFDGSPVVAPVEGSAPTAGAPVASESCDLIRLL